MPQDYLTPLPGKTVDPRLPQMLQNEAQKSALQDPVTQAVAQFGPSIAGGGPLAMRALYALGAVGPSKDYPVGDGASGVPNFSVVPSYLKGVRAKAVEKVVPKIGAPDPLDELISRNKQVPASWYERNQKKRQIEEVFRKRAELEKVATMVDPKNPAISYVSIPRPSETGSTVLAIQPKGAIGTRAADPDFDRAHKDDLRYYDQVTNPANIGFDPKKHEIIGSNTFQLGKKETDPSKLELNPLYVKVDPNNRRQGIATNMYDLTKKNWEKLKGAQPEIRNDPNAQLEPGYRFRQTYPADKISEAAVQTLLKSPKPLPGLAPSEAFAPKPSVKLASPTLKLPNENLSLPQQSVPPPTPQTPASRVEDAFAVRPRMEELKLLPRKDVERINQIVQDRYSSGKIQGTNDFIRQEFGNRFTTNHYNAIIAAQENWRMNRNR